MEVLGVGLPSEHFHINTLNPESPGYIEAESGFGNIKNSSIEEKTQLYQENRLYQLLSWQQN